MQRRASLQTVLRSRLVVRHLLPTIDEALLLRRDSFLFFDALFYFADFVVGLDVEFDFFAG